MDADVRSGFLVDGLWRTDSRELCTGQIIPPDFRPAEYWRVGQLRTAVLDPDNSPFADSMSEVPRWKMIFFIRLKKLP